MTFGCCAAWVAPTLRGGGSKPRPTDDLCVVGMMLRDACQRGELFLRNEDGAFDGTV